MEGIDFALVDWSRAQFALTAMFHWIFVPLTLGITFIIAIMESIYVKTGDQEWKRITKFWTTVFGINFAIGVATGIILEFEFGTNWSNYSWFVGDIFGAPLAIEGIMAFFMESVFIAVMFFGWNKVSKQFHLLSTWLVAIGSNLSALWILVANGWMQYPAGMEFNPDTVRNEMANFWEVLFSPVAINKFIHTITSGYVLAAIFMVGVSSWFLIKKREILFAKRSIVVAATFGFLSSGYLIFSGDESARTVAKYQPMKFAAMEGLYDGVQNAPLVAMGFFGETKKGGSPDEIEFAFKLEIPDMLSYMAFLDANAFVPGIQDLVNGNEEHGIESYHEKIRKGKMAIESLTAYKKAKDAGNKEEAIIFLKAFRDNFKYFGYGYYFGKDINMLVPNVRLSFYSFHIMVILGGHFMLLFILVLYFTMKNKIENKKWLLWSALLTIPLAYIASESGWVLAEVGRQPWVIQDLMPNIAAVSQIDASSVQVTFFLFLAIFTTLFIAEVKIMLTQIKKGPASKIDQQSQTN
ncbi:MAG: cytochrome ubiquinol oxidase subunit I [Bacteroidales bacterium]|nr:cytochrome ubiquinol oxidase subunit I [Bacteroidales bacterium]